MKLQVLLVLLAVLSWTEGRPNDILDFETDEGEHEQEGTAGKAVEGEYSWVAPDGTEYYVKYVADHLGYRVIESDVVHKSVVDVGKAIDGKA